MTDYWATDKGQARPAPGSEWRAKESAAVTNYWETEAGQGRRAPCSE